MKASTYTSQESSNIVKTEQKSFAAAYGTVSVISDGSEASEMLHNN